MKFSIFQYLLQFVTVVIFAFLITPLFRKIARKFNILDHPGGRKLQANPVAYLGGLSIVTPITLGSFSVLFTSLSVYLKQQLFFGLIMPAIVIAIVGLLDDMYQLPPWPRFISQTAVGIATSFILYSL